MEEEGMMEKDLRCTCGALVARRVAGGVEIRCRRCRRTVLVPDGLNGDVQVDPCQPPRPGRPLPS